MSENNIILGGSNNTIQQSFRCTIINGQNNTVSSKTNTHIIGDYGTASANNTFYVGCSNGLFCDGGIIADYNFSDERLKDGMSEINNCTEKIMRLDAVEFDWNDKQQTYSGHDIGIIAQQVKEEFPQIVETRDSGYLAVRYDRLISVLVGANNEQFERLGKIESRIKS